MKNTKNFTIRQIKQTLTETVLETQDNLYYNELDRKTIFLAIEELQNEYIMKSISAKDTPIYLLSIKQAMQNNTTTLLRKSSNKLLSIQENFEKTCLLHSKILASRPKWKGPEIDRQNWLHRFNQDKNKLQEIQEKVDEINQDNEQNSSNQKFSKNRKRKNMYKKNQKNKNGNIENSEASWTDVMAQSGKLIDYIRTIKANPHRLHNELWFNDLGQANDGPICRCENDHKNDGIRHSIYPGEKKPPKLSNDLNNIDKLYHYVLVISVNQGKGDGSSNNYKHSNNNNDNPNIDMEGPFYLKNFYYTDSDQRTFIPHDNRKFYFEGYSIFSHYPLDDILPAESMRFHCKYQFNLIPQLPPKNFTVKDLILFQDFVFRDMLEIVDWLESIICPIGTADSNAGSNGASQQYFYFLPRFIYRDDPTDWCGIYLDHEARSKKYDQKIRSGQMPGNKFTNFEILPMRLVLQYLTSNFKPILTDEMLPMISNMSPKEWNDFVSPIRGQLAVLPGARPSSIRIDQIDQRVSLNEYENYLKNSLSDWEEKEINNYVESISDDEENQENQDPKTKIENHNTDFNHFSNGDIDTRWWTDKKLSKTLQVDMKSNYTTIKGHTPFHVDRIDMPVIVHHGIRPANLSYAGDPRYQKVWRSYLKLRHLNVNKPDLTENDIKKEKMREHILSLIRKRSDMKKETLNLVSAKGFHLTGCKSDLTTWAAVLPLLTHHIRYQKCLSKLEEIISYKFNERLWLTSSLTHPSYQLNFGWNADHVRNAMNNCGLRQPLYGDIGKEQLSLRKKGITTLIRVMAKLGKSKSALSPIEHNERLEFLGDSVLGFIVSEALYRLFPHFSEGSLSILRTSVVQNYNLSILAKKIGLSKFMLYAHGLSKDADLNTAMANCFEAILGAIYIDGGLEVARKFLCRFMFDWFGGFCKLFKKILTH